MKNAITALSRNTLGLQDMKIGGLAISQKINHNFPLSFF